MTGVTPEGRHVVSGVFKIYNGSSGMSLSDLIDLLWENGMVVDWGDFLMGAHQHNMGLDSIERLIRGGFSDSIHCRNDIDRVREFFERLKGGREEVVPQGSHKA